MRHIMRVFLTAAVLVAAVVIGGTLATAQPAGRAAPSYQNITPSQLNTMLRKKDFVLWGGSFTQLLHGRHGAFNRA